MRWKKEIYYTLLGRFYCWLCLYGNIDSRFVRKKKNFCLQGGVVFYGFTYDAWIDKISIKKCLLKSNCSKYGKITLKENV